MMQRALTAATGVMAWLLAGMAAAQAMRPEIMAPPEEEPPFGADLYIVAPELPIPQNGAFLIWFELLGDPVGREPMPIVQVAQSDGERSTTFGGQLHHVAGVYYAWLPNAPLELGTYVIGVAHPEAGPRTEQVQVVAATDLEPAAFTIQSRMVRDFEVSRYVSCFESLDPEFVDEFTWPLLEVARLNMQTSVLPDESGAHSQFLFRVVRGRFDFTPFSAIVDTVSTGPFVAEEGERCAHVEVLNVMTSEVRALRDTCATYRGDTSTEERLITDSPALSRYNCQRAPEGFEGEWCAANVQCIELWRTPELIDVNNCRDYFEQCPDAVQPDAGTPDAGTPDAGQPWNGKPMVIREADAGEDAPSHPAGDDGAGCAVAPRGRASRGWLVTLFALSLCAARLRRRYCRGVASTHASSAT